VRAAREEAVKPRLFEAEGVALSRVDEGVLVVRAGTGSRAMSISPFNPLF
jgi:hypothetical protein